MPTLLLFVRGAGATGNDAIAVVRAFEPSVTVDVVDVFQQPDMAARYGVVATPTLVKLGPGTSSRVVGNITRERVLGCLSQ